MRGSSILIGVVVAILWYFSVFYIAAPHDVHNMLFGGFGMTHLEHQVLGLMLFMISLLIITIWAVSTDEGQSTKKATTSTSPLPSSKI